MFDEQDRHMRLRFNSSTRSISVDASPRRGGSLFPAPEDSFAESPGGGPPTAGDPTPGNGGAGAPNPSTPTPPVDSESPPESYQPYSHRASDSRPQVGTVRAQVLASGNPDDLRSLEQEAKQLESLARELDSRADSLERRARELR